MHGQPFSSDSHTRWQSTLQVARALSLDVPKDLIIQLDKDLNTPELGYPGIHQLLLRRRDFTAVLCFNDISAIGSIRALHDAGLQCTRRRLRHRLRRHPVRRLHRPQPHDHPPAPTAHGRPRRQLPPQEAGPRETPRHHQSRSRTRHPRINRTGAFNAPPSHSLTTNQTT